MSFYRAYAHQAETLAREVGITDAGAKDMMHQTFKDAEGRELFDWGKELDDQYYRPQIEAEKKEREQNRSRSGERSAREDSGARSGSYQRQHRSAARAPSRPRP